MAKKFQQKSRDKMEKSVSELELKALNEIISIANEFTSEEYQKKIELNKDKYKGVIPIVTYTTCPQKDGHSRSSIELKYVTQDEEITICFLDGKTYWINTPKDFTKRIKDKLCPEGL